MIACFFNDTATTEIYTLSLHDAPSDLTAEISSRTLLPSGCAPPLVTFLCNLRRRVSTLRSEEHTSELQSRQYLVCRLLLEKKPPNSSPTLRRLSPPTLSLIFFFNHY